jgi:hypothetical protein
MNGVLLKLRLPKARSIDWRTVQDEEHILLKCLHEHQANLRNQHQLVFPSQYEDSPTRFRAYLDQPDVSSVACVVAECLAFFPSIFLAPFLVWFLAFPKLPL